jgi:transglutaminase-like putative cysteine protease
MRLAGIHTTRYVYSAPVTLDVHLLRLRVREEAAQRLHRFELDIHPRPAGQAWLLDLEGNNCLQAWWAGQTERLEIRTEFEVEVLRDNPFDFLPAPGAGQMPPLYSDTEALGLAPYLAPPPSGLAPLLEEWGLSQKGAVPFLLELAAKLHRDFEQTTRLNGPPHPPEHTFRERAGSCRDLAVLFNALCRSAGLAARFVSGYDRAAALEDEGHMHAWSEVYLPGAGWRGFDPARGLAVGSDHVALAAGAQPESTMPVTGSYFGQAEARLEHRVQLDVLPPRSA